MSANSGGTSPGSVPSTAERPAGEQKMERAAEAVDVGADIGRVRIVGLLRRHVVAAAEAVAAPGDGHAAFRLGDEIGEPEIQDLDLPARVEHQIRAA